MRLPFSKKKDTPQQTSSAPKRKRSSAGVPESALARPRRQGNHWANEWRHPDPPAGLPGICGYLNGVKEGEEGHHPSRFLYVRPDGQPDDVRPTEQAPGRPSTRRVPRGFFGS